MNFYKIFDEERKIIKIFNLDIVQCFVVNVISGYVDFYYGSRDFINIPLTDELIKKLKEIGVLK